MKITITMKMIRIKNALLIHREALSSDLLMMIVINQCFGKSVSSPLSFPVLLAGIPSRQYFGTLQTPTVESP